jgi:transcriptional repressor NrdR
LKCPFCKAGHSRVVDSRASADGFAIRRRRECLSCNRRYTTYERIEESPLRVVKKDGRREPFDRRKILMGLLKACEKRPVSMDTLEEIVSRIEHHVTDQFEREVPSKFIGRQVMRELRKVDPVAYVRFASVYRDFKDVSEFVEEIQPMLKESGRGAAEKEPGRAGTDAPAAPKKKK